MLTLWWARGRCKAYFFTIFLDYVLVLFCFWRLGMCMAFSPRPLLKRELDSTPFFHCFGFGPSTHAHIYILHIALFSQLRRHDLFLHLLAIYLDKVLGRAPASVFPF
jgi:hypothetical protein